MAGLPSDKMQLVGLGDLLHPASCMSCGSGNYEGGYVRLGVYYDYEGEMYLCGNCLNEAADTGGLLTRDEADHLRSTASEAISENVALKEEMEIARERLSIFDRAVIGALNDGALIPAGLGYMADQDSTEQQPVKPEQHEQDPSEPSGGESGTTEPTSLLKRSSPRSTKRSDSPTGISI